MIRTLSTLGRLKAELRKAKTVYVWVNWQGDEGDYVEVNKSKLLRSIGADTPNDGAHGGKHDATPADFRVECDAVYVN